MDEFDVLTERFGLKLEGKFGMITMVAMEMAVTL